MTDHDSLETTAPEHPDISVVIPLLNETESLPELCERIVAHTAEVGLSHEIIFVDDGSSDDSWQVIKQLAARDAAVHAIKFHRNYSKSSVLQCSFARTCGRVAIAMDADLQDAPKEIGGMYNMVVREGYDLVSGWKKKRYDPLSRTIPTKLFNATVRRVPGIKNLHDFNCRLKAYRAEVVHSIELYNDMHHYIPYLAKNTGFAKIGEQAVHHAPRRYRHSKFGLDRFFNGYLDLLTFWFTHRFGRKLMHFFGFWGSLMFLTGFMALIVVLSFKLPALISGTPTPLVTNHVYFYISLAAMIVGVQLFCAGFIGEVITRRDPNRDIYNIETEL